MTVIKLVERVQEDDDAALAIVITEAIPETLAEALEIELRFFLGLAFGCEALGGRDVAVVEFVEQAADEVVAVGRLRGGADEVGDEEQ